MTILDIALDYISRGWNPVPIPYRKKRPFDDEWQARIIDAATAPQYFNGEQMNIGVMLGASSGNLADVDLDCVEAIAIAPYILPRTGAIFGRKSNRNSHRLYVSDLASTTDTAVFQFRDPQAGNDNVLLELRVGANGKGAQTVFPGSTHKETGEAIAWEVDGTPATVAGDSLLRRIRVLATCCLIACYWPSSGSRHHGALVIGGFLARTGRSPAAVKVIVEAIARAVTDEEWRDRRKAAEDAATAHAQSKNVYGLPALAELLGDKIAGKVAEWLNYKEAAAAANVAPPQQSCQGHIAPAGSEEALALEFADCHATELRFVAVWNKWLRWENGCWQPDATLAVYDYARALCRAEATKTNKPGKKAAMIASAKTRAAVVSLAREDRRIAATIEQWDANPWLFNTPDGIVDLQTGVMRAHRPDDYATKMTAVSPRSIPTPIWDAFLERVTANDPELVAYLDRMCGYVLTGSTREHALFFLYGTGGNGKGVYLGTLAGILGNYHVTAPIETFTASNVESHPTELARLHGARVVTSTETEEGRRWAESRIKMLTGGDHVSARFMRQDFFEYSPQFKLLISGNHKPGLRSVDEAIRRRLNLVPFNVTIPTAQRDVDLLSKLRAEWPGILAKMIAGCLEWQRIGLMPPAIVRNATAAYLENEDAVAAWIDDCCQRDVNAFEPPNVLFASWKAWAEANGEYVGNQRQFANKLLNREVQQHRKSGRSGRGYRGLRLVGDAPSYA